MKDKPISQEILLMINTKFAAKEYVEKEGKDGREPHPVKLAEACCNGMLSERLPELRITPKERPLTLWQLCEGVHLLYLKLGEQDDMPAAEYTINPYRFADHVSMN